MASCGTVYTSRIKEVNSKRTAERFGHDGEELPPYSGNVVSAAAWWPPQGCIAKIIDGLKQPSGVIDDADLTELRKKGWWPQFHRSLGGLLVRFSFWCYTQGRKRRDAFLPCFPFCSPPLDQTSTATRCNDPVLHALQPRSALHV